MQPTVAIVEDETDLREGVAEYLSDRGLRVIEAESAAAFRTVLAQNTVDVAVLDIAMPGEDGLSLARWIKGRGARPGIILATSAGTTVDRVVGIEIGADDYVVKPYDLRELLARVRSVLRRLPDAGEVANTPPPAAATRRLVPVGSLVLDLDRQRLTDRSGTSVELTAMELTLLKVLMARPNRPLSRAQLLELTGTRADNGGERSIDIRVARLRRKIEADPDQPALIRTLRGEGYVFVPSGASPP